MIKELKYYFSDINVKNSYRSFKQIDEITIKYSENLILLNDNTSEIVEYAESNDNNVRKNYNFWKLIINND